MTPFKLEPIGYVRNEISAPGDIPYNGAASVLELLPQYLDASAGLEPGYIWVVTWLDRAERVHARPGGRGSFASRTPNRLNPVGLTAARLLRIEGERLYVDALDACEGTPLLDVKPYVREFDCVFGPADPAWRRAQLPEQRLARLVRTIERFCGPLTAETALAARVALAADRDLDTAANSHDLVWECGCRVEVAAGIQAVCGAPLGSARFVLGRDEGRVRVSLPGKKAVGYRLVSGVAGTAEEILALPEAELLTVE